MDPQRQRIQDDLRGVVAGDVLCDDLYLQLYASDASLYEIRPLGVVRPRNTADVVACVQYAAEQHIPLHARGAGSGLAGESLGAGLILDFSRYMRRIISSTGETVRVQPGLVHALLNDHLAMQGRTFGPDPAMTRVTTIGSMIAIDASGSHWLQFGSARAHVESLQVVLADGTLVEVGREAVAPPNPDPVPPRKRDVINRLAELLTREAPLINTKQPRARVNQCGYRLVDVLADGHINLAKLLSGSEGTLAIITEATIDTQPIPKHRGIAVLLFESLEAAARAVQDILPLLPTACDLLDRRHISLARETDVQYQLMIPPDAEALLLVEHCGNSLLEVRRRVGQVVETIWHKKRLAFDARQIFDRDEMDLYWQLAQRVIPRLHRLKGTARALPFVEDVAVPPAMLPEFFPRMQNVLKRHQVMASLYGHVGHGQLHLRPFLDLATPDDVQRMRSFADDLYQEVVDVGGTISGEHGDGLSRTPYIRKQYGDLYPVFREVKRIFDPHNILNPGKIIGEDIDPLAAYLRPILLAGTNGSGNGHNLVAPTDGPSVAFSGEPSPDISPLSFTDLSPSAAPAAPISDSSAPAHSPSVIPLQLNWTPAEMAQAAARCNGCGACRSQSADVRMCPIFRFAPAEEASPRAKANLMRALVDGRIDPQSITRDDFKTIADLCVNCHMCRLECPAGVDIPKLMMEAKGSYVATNSLQPRELLFTRLNWLGAAGGFFGAAANWAIGNRQARWLLEKTLGIAKARKLPRFAPRNFLRRANRLRLTRPTRRSGRKIAYFVDVYAIYHDPLLAMALVNVLEHNGVAVYVPPTQRPAGMAMISQGALGPARKTAQHNVTMLAETVRQGYHIVCSEPTAALCLKHEYLHLLDNDDDAQLVADNTSEACTYLWGLHRAGTLQLDFKPVNATVSYHMPCHLKALGVGSPGENLMRLIPGLTVVRTERGCSGMAGTYGLKRENFRNSIRAGWGLISSLRDPRLQAGTTECSTCKMQMEQGTTKPTVHPLKLLALSYGIMPEFASLLTTRGEDLVVT